MRFAILLASAVAAACGLVVTTRFLRTQARGVLAYLLDRTESDLAQLFIFISAGRLRLAAAIVVLGICTLGWFFLLPLPAIALAAGIAALSPRITVAVLRHRWRRRLMAQLPDALALWAGLLRAGQAMAPALTQLAARQANPLGAELRLVLSQYRLGVPLDSAVAQLRDRASVPDLRLLATLLRAQRDLGGNLAEALERLAALLRNRMAMEARIRSLTAQGRLQGIVVGILPLLLAGVLVFMEPDAMQALTSTPIGWTAMGLIAALEVAGFVMIRRIVSIDV